MKPLRFRAIPTEDELWARATSGKITWSSWIRLANLLYPSVGTPAKTVLPPLTVTARGYYAMVAAETHALPLAA